MVLKDQWQGLREQRRQELRERRQQIHVRLHLLQKERQAKAQQLHDELSQFRQHLAIEAQLRAEEATFRTSMRQQFCRDLNSQTQAFLSNTGIERQVQAQKLAQQLDEFVLALQEQTAQFLSLTASERTLMAVQIAQDLRAFHKTLSATVAMLRQKLQTKVETLKVETQQLLTASYQQRILTHAELSQDLAIFAETLRGDIQDYLQELEVMRSDRAQQLQQSLQDNRANRLASVRALFERLALFRVELQDYCANLHLEGWGTDGADMPAPAAIVTPKAPQVEASVTVASKPVVAPSEPAAIAYEKEVYKYIHQAQSARLVAIEAALGINRIQAVDALRSLLKKGLITQRERTYILQTHL